MSVGIVGEQENKYINYLNDKPNLQIRYIDRLARMIMEGGGVRIA